MIGMCKPHQRYLDACIPCVFNSTKGEAVRKIVEEVSEEGMESLLGQRVTLLCLNYIYTGKLVGVNATCVLLESPAIVYETGPWDAKAYKDAQALPSRLYVQIAAIESFGPLKG